MGPTMTDDETFDEHAARTGVAAEKPPYGSTAAVAEVGGPVVVEVLGWDEGFWVPAPMIRRPLPAEAQRAVKDASGLSCSVGIGDNRLRAKLATGFAKPAGGYRLTRDNWMAVMAGRPTDALWGIGARTTKKPTRLA